MGTTDSLHGDGHLQSLVGQDREATDYVTSLLKAMYDKMGVLEGKVDLLQSSVNQIGAAVLPKHLVTDNHVDDDENTYRRSSSYLVVNSHNNSSHLAEKPPTPSKPDSPQTYPLSSPVGINFPAESSEPLKTLKECIDLQTNHIFPDSNPDHESSDEEGGEEDDEDDSESSTSEEEAEFTTVQMELGVEEIPEVEKPVANKNNSSELNTAETKTPVAKSNGLVNFGFSDFFSRAESPLPETVNFAHAGFSWCKRNGVEASEDNRAKYFHKAVKHDDEEKTGKQQKDHSDPVSDSTTSPEKPPADGDLPDDEASGGFVPNNQLVSTSGFKNDHGHSDNRFDDEAHNDTRSFLTTIRPELTNMAVIQHDARSTDHAGSDPRPLSQTNGFLPDHVGPTSGGFDTGVSPAARNARNSPRSAAGSPLDASVRPSSGSSGRSDSEKEPFVGDAYIQALIQTQKMEAEANTELKSQGLDTVICLDTSQSMDGKPLQLAKEAIYTFLDGVETATVEFDLEENVSIVTFGNENKVQQHLTNNYDNVRDKVESLEAGGPSPLWLGLAMALTELGTRGGSCKMSELSVLPRIIVITDGFATEKNRLHGMDGDVTEEKTRSQIQSLVAKNTGSVSSIDCITVGVHNKSLLSEISGGRVSTSENLQHLVEFFRTKSITNECLLRSKDGQMTEMKLRGMIQACNLQEQRSIDDVVWDVKGRITLAEDSLPDESAVEPWPAEVPTETREAEVPVETPEIQETEVPTEKQEIEVPTETQEVEVPTESQEKEVSMETQENEDLNMTLKSDPASSEMETSISESNQINMSETIQPGHLPEDVTDFPAFGTRVRSCPGSEEYINTQDMVGTVVGHRKDRLKVLWTDGMIEKCRYGDNGHFDVRVNDDFDRDNSAMKIGARVQRGADWKWEEQDGGVGSVGIVFKVDDRKKVVHVVWANNQQGNYRYGYKDCFDVQLAPNELETIPQEKEEEKVVWEIELQESRWQVFPEEVSQSLEDMYSVNSRNTFLIKTNDISYRISLTQSIARDLDTQMAYPIRRQVMSREAWLELLREQ